MIFKPTINTSNLCLQQDQIGRRAGIATLTGKTRAKICQYCSSWFNQAVTVMILLSNVVSLMWLHHPRQALGTYNSPARKRRRQIARLQFKNTSRYGPKLRQRMIIVTVGTLELSVLLLAVINKCGLEHWPCNASKYNSFCNYQLLQINLLFITYS